MTTGEGERRATLMMTQRRDALRAGGVSGDMLDASQVLLNRAARRALAKRDRQAASRGNADGR